MSRSLRRGSEAGDVGEDGSPGLGRVPLPPLVGVDLPTDLDVVSPLHGLPAGGRDELEEQVSDQTPVGQRLNRPDSVNRVIESASPLDGGHRLRPVRHDGRRQTDEALYLPARAHVEEEVGIVE